MPDDLPPDPGVRRTRPIRDREELLRRLLAGEWLLVVEAATLLGRARRTVWDWTAAGKLGFEADQDSRFRYVDPLGVLKRLPVDMRRLLEQQRQEPDGV